MKCITREFSLFKCTCLCVHLDTHETFETEVMVEPATRHKILENRCRAVIDTEEVRMVAVIDSELYNFFGAMPISKFLDHCDKFSTREELTKGMTEKYGVRARRKLEEVEFDEDDSTQLDFSNDWRDEMPDMEMNDTENYE